MSPRCEDFLYIIKKGVGLRAAWRPSSAGEYMLSTKQAVALANRSGERLPPAFFRIEPVHSHYLSYPCRTLHSDHKSEDLLVEKVH